MLTLAFVLGTLFGACLGLFTFCLLQAGHNADAMAACLDCPWHKVTP